MTFAINARRSLSAGLIFFLIILAVGSTDTEEENDAAYVKKMGPAPELGSSERVAWEVKKVLRSSNRDVPRVGPVTYSGDTIEVHFAINDNITDSLVALGAKQDVTKILQAAQASGGGFNVVRVYGTMSMVDKFGAASEEVILKVEYLRSTIDRIQWENFLLENAYEVADEAWVHPALRK